MMYIYIHLHVYVSLGIQFILSPKKAAKTIVLLIIINVNTQYMHHIQYAYQLHSHLVCHIL